MLRSMSATVMFRWSMRSIFMAASRKLPAYFPERHRLAGLRRRLAGLLIAAMKILSIPRQISALRFVRAAGRILAQYKSGLCSVLLLNTINQDCQDKNCELLLPGQATRTRRFANSLSLTVRPRPGSAGRWNRPSTGFGGLSNTACVRGDGSFSSQGLVMCNWL